MAKNLFIHPRPLLDRALLSVVLPVFNEAGVVASLTESLIAVLAPLMRFEILFVNDGSHDDSPAILDALASQHAEVRVIHFARNFGQQAAVQAGLAHARGDAVVVMDSDQQDSPAAIRQFVALWQEGYDVVYALRKSRQEAWWKRCLFAGFHRFLHAIADTQIPARAGLFSLMDRRVVSEVMALGEHDRYLPGLRSWVGFRQTGVEIDRGVRYDDHPRISLRGLWRLAKTAIFSFSSFPLQVFSWIGYLAMAVFMLLGGFSLACKIFTACTIPGWTSYVLIASFFGALNALGISMLGEYVIRIYDQVRRRPLYVVDRAVNFSIVPLARDLEVLHQGYAEPAWAESY
ncbi:MAG TPA: glycosyltransferase family 2 protein [Pirellulales bacterium]|jgi:dolichol-phosphate mannosyltransferase|nr:glycosyltransferase family 2 protein [Pirellulales bacterium]